MGTVLKSRDHGFETIRAYDSDDESPKDRTDSLASFVQLGLGARAKRCQSTLAVNHDQSAQSLSDALESTQTVVKNRVKGWWANMIYGWHALNAGTQIDISDLDGSEPIYLIGQVYHNRNNPGSFKKFFVDFSSRVWFTYRQDFLPIESSGHTSDSGWGCMIRSGQMILAEAFVRHLLGRGWRWSPKEEDGVHRRIISWFADDGDPQRAPFGLRNLIRESSQFLDKRAGDWFGPQMIVYLLKRCMEEAGRTAVSRGIFEQLAVYVAQDCTIYTEDVMNLCTADPSIQWKSVIIFIPVRLGEARINTDYVHGFREILAHPNCIGIIGGKPRHSLYFTGFQGNKILYLDPHYLQKALDVEDIATPLKSFHCTLARKISFSKLDPSSAIGFYCKTRKDFENFIASAKDLETSSQSSSRIYPIFIVNDDSSNSPGGRKSSHTADRMYATDSATQARDASERAAEEYVLLD